MGEATGRGQGVLWLNSGALLRRRTVTPSRRANTVASRVVRQRTRVQHAFVHAQPPRVVVAGVAAPSPRPAHGEPRFKRALKTRTGVCNLMADTPWADSCLVRMRRVVASKEEKRAKRLEDDEDFGPYLAACNPFAKLLKHQREFWKRRG